MMYVANSEFINTGKRIEVCKTASWFIWRKELGFVLAKQALATAVIIGRAVRVEGCSHFDRRRRRRRVER